jgi:threonine synthase
MTTVTCINGIVVIGPQHRFLETGRMTQREVKPTIAPAMDIQISSNFERYLHYLCDEEGTTVAQLMADSKASALYDYFMLAPCRSNNSFMAMADRRHGC